MGSDQLCAMLPSRSVADGPTCAENDPDIWFDPDRRTEAKGLCGRCPIELRAACLIESLKLDHREIQHGVWAGMLPNQRVQIKRRYGIVTEAHARALVDLVK